ncbi:MAG TPA: hypothetical protein V6D11_22670 [Waterburya sp.]
MNAPFDTDKLGKVARALLISIDKAGLFDRCEGYNISHFGGRVVQILQRLLTFLLPSSTAANAVENGLAFTLLLKSTLQELPLYDFQVECSHPN